MTTIAWDGESIAADSRSSYHNNSVNKLHRLPDGSVVAGAGETECILRAIKALEAGDSYEAESSKFTLLRAFPDGHAEVCHGLMEWMRVDGHYFAVGSGSDYAMGALACGSTAQEAVAISAQFDGATGGPIDLSKVTI